MTLLAARFGSVTGGHTMHKLVKDLKAAIATVLQEKVVRYDVEVRMAGDSRLVQSIYAGTW